MSWIENIQGLTTLKTWLDTALSRRSSMKVGGLPVYDDGTQTVLNGVQQITGSGTWDGKSGIVQVKGSGARSIAVPDPTDAAAGLTVTFTDAAGSAGAGTITLDPSGAGTIAGASTSTITTNWNSRTIQFVSAGVWALV
jgi:hypothetical protein